MFRHGTVVATRLQTEGSAALEGKDSDRGRLRDLLFLVLLFCFIVSIIMEESRARKQEKLTGMMTQCEGAKQSPFRQIGCARVTRRFATTRKCTWLNTLTNTPNMHHQAQQLRLSVQRYVKQQSNPMSY